MNVCCVLLQCCGNYRSCRILFCKPWLLEYLDIASWKYELDEPLRKYVLKHTRVSVLFFVFCHTVRHGMSTGCYYFFRRPQNDLLSRTWPCKHSCTKRNLSYLVLFREQTVQSHFTGNSCSLLCTTHSWLATLLSYMCTSQDSQN